MGINYNAQSVTYGLVLYFDAANPKSYSGSGTTAYDISGNNAVGTMSNVTYSNGYMSFNGSSSYIDFGNPSVLALSNAITIISWTYPIDTNGLGNIVAKNYNSGYRVRHEQTNNLWWYVSGNSISTPNSSVSLNTWNYNAVTGDSSGLKAYVNNSLLASNATAFSPSAPATGNLYIGCVFPGGEHFNGRISLVQIYNRALTQSEILQNYIATKGRYGL